VWIESQERIVEGLTKIKRSLCAYDSYGKDMVKYDGKEEETVICDCKYGADKNTEGKGCPEVSAARHIIAAMTPKEYARILKRLQTQWKGKRKR
jgi:hypothetical protein